MRILLAYYSKSGGTEKLAEAIKKEFEDKGHSVDIEKIQPVKEHGFWCWWFLRMIKSEYDIQPPKIKDVSEYDVICLGSPNWTRLSLPMARYLKEIQGLKYKNIGVFATTTLFPSIEWYILSLYLFDLTFSRAIEEKDGRIIGNLILSSFFKEGTVNSEYGKKEVKNFCDKLETPIQSFKVYFLKQKEIESTRFSVVLFSFLLFLSFLFQIISTIIGKQVFGWSEYLFLFVIGFFSYFSLLTILAGNTWVFWGKYIVGITLPALLTLTPLFLMSTQGTPIIFGYFLIFIIISFFRDPKAVLFTGILTLFMYSYLFFTYPLKEVFRPIIDVPFLLLSIGMISFITKNIQKHYISSLEVQDEIETARKKAEDEKNKTSTIIVNFSDGLLVFDSENKLSLINPQAEAFLKIKIDDVVKKTIPELSQAPDFEPIANLLGKDIKKIFRKELELKDNLILELSTVPMMSREKEKLGTLLILHDVSREKIIERMKTEFVSMAAHQLRTPLSVIKWTLSMFLAGDFGKIKQEQKNYIEKTYQNNERMIYLINDLLDVARIEEGRYVYKPALINLGELIQIVVDSYQEVIKRKKLKLNFDKPKTLLPQVAVDVEKIKLVIQNLIDNAIKYTPSGGEVTVSLRINLNEAEVLVSDTGVGIPKDQKDSVFTKFFRGSNVKRMEIEGTGLGLFISKNIIEAHKGKIWFESEEKRGTTFHFTLPFPKNLPNL